MPPQPYAVLPPAPEKGPNGLGVAALVLGILALLFAFIPILSFIAWLPALVAIALGIAGLVARNRRRGTAIAGLSLGVAAVIVSIAVSVVSVAAVAGAASDAASSASDSNAGGSGSDDNSDADGASGAKVATVGTPFLADMGNGDVARITIMSAKYKKHDSTGAFASDADH